MLLFNIKWTKKSYECILILVIALKLFLDYLIWKRVMSGKLYYVIKKNIIFDNCGEEGNWTPGFLHAKQALYHWVTSPELKNWFGDGRHWSSYLLHAKQALYHLSYIPVMNIFLYNDDYEYIMVIMSSLNNQNKTPARAKCRPSPTYSGFNSKRPPWINHAMGALNPIRNKITWNIK